MQKTILLIISTSIQPMLLISQLITITIIVQKTILYYQTIPILWPYLNLIHRFLIFHIWESLCKSGFHLLGHFSHLINGATHCLCNALPSVYSPAWISFILRKRIGELYFSLILWLWWRIIALIVRRKKMKKKVEWKKMYQEKECTESNKTH